MPLSADDLMRLWRSSVDPEYARALLEAPDGVESGLVVVEMAAEVMARASLAVERTIQSFFLRVSSAQTGPPASGAGTAVVVLRVSRVGRADSEVVLQPNRFFVEEEAIEAGLVGGEPVGTGRRYTPLVPLVLVPGQLGPQGGVFIAERAGSGYNLPAPGTIVRTSAVGAADGLGATVVPGTTSHALVLAVRGETIPPAAVGQYVRFALGGNAGQCRRIVATTSPTDADNGTVFLAPTGVLRVTGVTGEFEPGEQLADSTGNFGALLGLSGGYLVYDQAGPLPLDATGLLTGVASGATCSIASEWQGPALAAESATAVWELLDWEVGCGLVVTNEASPEGGAIPVLDHIGEERAIGRAPGEDDESYRNRLEELPDVVSPNALVRVANRVLAPYGLSCCLREPGDIESFAGMFYDAVGTIDFYDLDFTVRPQDRYRLSMSHEEMRAFFLVTVPPLMLGEFGMFYDQGGLDFYDAAPGLSFFDGFPATAAVLYRRIWDGLNAARAGGVGFELVADPYGC